MGSNSIVTIAIGLGFLLGLTYFRSDDTRHFLVKWGIPANYLDYIMPIKITKETDDGNVSKSKSEVVKLLLTPEELKKYDGGPNSKGLYLAILGEIFDVEKGAQHYRPGGGYAFFSGRDATRAYITGDFSENSLTDNVLDLSDSSLAGIEDWISFYRDEYQFVGNVVGRYYDEKGHPTKELLTIREKLNHVQKNKYTEEKQKEIFPPCNSEWSKELGSRVWCTKKSGGIDRDWAGVPRQLLLKEKDPRCVCVKDYGTPSNDPNSKDHKNRGDLDHADLKEYPGCSTSADSCSVDHP